MEQGDFLNAVLIADDPASTRTAGCGSPRGSEEAAERVRGQKWGPRTLDVDLVTCHRRRRDQLFSRTDGLTLPHPLAHLRAFVLVPWLAVDPDAELTVADAV